MRRRGKLEFGGGRRVTKKVEGRRVDIKRSRIGGGNVFTPTLPSYSRTASTVGGRIKNGADIFLVSLM